MELRKCCNHPFLLDGVEAKECSDSQTNKELLQIYTRTSGKMVFLSKLLIKLKNENHKVLIFSQMTHMLDILCTFLLLLNYKFERIDGSITGFKRNQAIKHFNSDESCFVFLLSTKAGGVGINLSSADTVIIYDSDWNPQV